MINEKAKALITEERYGEYAPIFQELITRAIIEYNLSSEYVELFIKNCPKVKVGKMPDNVKWGFGLAKRGEELRLNKKIIKTVQKEDRPEVYEYLLHVINHEMYHQLNSNKGQEGITEGWNEALTEVASNRTSFGKNKQQLKDYRAETLGYGNLTFAVNILSAVMGCSEKKLIQLAFEHKITETLSRQLQYKSDAVDFLRRTGEELDKIKNATFEKGYTKEELKQIQTDAYHKIYVLR